MSNGLERFAFEPFLVALAFLVAIAVARCLLFLFACARFTGTTSDPARPPGTERKLASLESLRGVLAMSVVAHHACCWYYFAQTGIWTTGNSIIFARLAPFGVAQFFYLSGYLFWRKLMKAERIPFAPFYLSRFVRIAPVYYACLAAAILTGLLSSGVHLQPAGSAWLLALIPWLLFSLGGQPAILHVDVAQITAGISWTLALEWLFYLSLPLLPWFSRHARRLIAFALIFLALHWIAGHLPSGPFFHHQLAGPGPLNSAGLILSTFAKFMLVGFGGGILIATFETHLRTKLGFLKPAQNWLLLALYLAYLLVPGIATLGQILLLAAFALVISGAGLFGLLASNSVRFLGQISYPVYLLHGLVFYAAMQMRRGIHPVALAPYLAETAACLVAIQILSVLVHVSIEQPATQLSEIIARRAKLPRLHPLK